MNRLLRTGREYFSSTSLAQFNLPGFGFLSPISRFHSPSDTPFPDSKLGLSDEFSKPPPSTGDGAPSDRTYPTKPTLRHLLQWPEWVDFMTFLSTKGYLEEGGGNPFQNGQMGVKEPNRIRTACLTFARDRFDLIRYLMDSFRDQQLRYFLNLRASYFSRQDIEAVAGSGCPSTDRKVVNSGKRLRAYVDIDEGNVCSSCILRGDCDRAYLMARKSEAARTVDLMRILLTYGLDPITGAVENVMCRSRTMEESARRLLKATVEFCSKEFDSLLPNATSSERAASLQASSAPAEKGATNLPTREGDWLCSKCNFLNFARNFKCLRCNEIPQDKLKKLWEDQDHLPLKKGDWMCDKCNFLNFAKNTRCLLCKEKPPKRELNPGDWECDSCNYINFARNMVCLKCDHRRQKALNSSLASAHPGHRTRGSYNPNGLRFVRDEDETRGDPPKRQEIQNPNNVSASWSFVEGESKDIIDGSNSWEEVPGFVDFPIAGGKSELSQDSNTRLKWKAEMLKKSRPHSRERQSRPSSPLRRPAFVECSSDEEMTEWFGHGGRYQTEERKPD